MQLLQNGTVTYKVRLAQLAFSVLSLLSLWPGSPMGAVGEKLAKGLYFFFGYSAWVFAAGLGSHAIRLKPSYVAVACCTVYSCTWLTLIGTDGGYLGHLMADGLRTLLGAGAYIVAVLASLHAVHTWSQGRVTQQILHAQAHVARSVPKLVAQRKALPKPKIVVAEDQTDPCIDLQDHQYTTEEPDLYVDVEPTPTPEPKIVEPALEPMIVEPAPKPKIVVRPKAAVAGVYRLPSTELLDVPPEPKPLAKEQTEKMALDIRDKLLSFGVKGKVKGVQAGPVVSMYEFDPADGVKSEQIKKLDVDLSRELQRSVRVVPALPGTTCVGIEVPHEEKDRQIVSLRDLLDDVRWAKLDAVLPLAVGKQIDGNPLFADLANMPHLLIAGATGAGKSVGLNSMLASLLFRLTPKQLRLILIDPKVVEFAQFGAIPHLLVPVITEVEPALIAMKWAMREMDRRYDLLAAIRVKNVQSYNNQVSESEQLPLVVLVVDEFADLIAVGGKDLEQAVQRVAQKARAAGIHLIIATQRPSVDVITGVIKANMPSRIAYRVAQREDSKTILGGGTRADQLTGKGDLLAQLPGSTELQRAHSAYLSDEELGRVCDYLRSQGEPAYDDSVLTMPAGETADEASSLYDKAVALVASDGYCSISRTQTALKIGYVKASKLVEEMCAQGVVGPASTKAGGRRDVLVTAQ